MDDSARNDKATEKVTKEKIFSLPDQFLIENIKENIVITTINTLKSSKEEIINQALTFHSQGNISEAAKYYQYFINQGFKDRRVFLIMEQFHKV